MDKMNVVLTKIESKLDFTPKDFVLSLLNKLSSLSDLINFKVDVDSLSVSDRDRLSIMLMEKFGR